MKLDHCAALITGASAGIGREFARQLAPSARLLVLAARRQERLQQLGEELEAAYPSLQIRTLAVDLSDSAQLRSLTDWLATDSLQLDLLVNDAGLGDLGSFVTSDPRRVEQIILVNMHALTMLTRAVLPGMLRRKRGAILNVSSCAGFQPIPNFAVYAASKAYVTSFTEAIRAELHGTGVIASALCPGPVHTEFTEVAGEGRPRHYPSPEFAHTPIEEVVRAGLAGIERERPTVIPGAVMKIANVLGRITPMPLLRIGMRVAAKRS